MGGLLRKWGEGVSLVRPDWKARDGGPGEGGEGEGEAEMEMEGEEDIEREMDVEGAEDLGGADAGRQGKKKAMMNGHATAPVAQRPIDANRINQTERRNPYSASRAAESQPSHQLQQPHSYHKEPPPHMNVNGTRTHQPSLEDKPSLGMDIDAMMDEMSSLSLVPSSVRFGRGGKSSGMGFAGAGRTAGVKGHGVGNIKGAVTGTTGSSASKVDEEGKEAHGAMEVEMSNGLSGIGGKDISADRPIAEKEKNARPEKTQFDTLRNGDRPGDVNEHMETETHVGNSLKGKGKSAQSGTRRGRDRGSEKELEGDMSMDDASLSPSPQSSPPLTKNEAAGNADRTNGRGRPQRGPQAQTRGRGTIPMRGGVRGGMGYGYGANGMSVAPRGGWIGAAMPRGVGLGMGVNGIGARGGLPPRGGRGRARGRGVARGGGRGGGDGGGM